MGDCLCRLGSGAKTQGQIHKYKYTDTNTQIQIQIPCAVFCVFLVVVEDKLCDRKTPLLYTDTTATGTHTVAHTLSESEMETTARL